MQSTQRHSWFHRHWKPILIILSGILLLIVITVTAWFQNSGPTELALATAISKPEFIKRLGQPVRTGLFIGGSIQESPGFGRAELAIPVSGPNGRGTLYALVEKRSGTWRLDLLEYGADGESSRLDLLAQ